MMEMIIATYHRDPLTFCSLTFILIVFLLSIAFLLIPLWVRTRQIRILRRQCARLRPVDSTSAETSRAVILKSLTARRWLEPAAREFDRRWRGAFLEEYAAALGEFRLSDFLNPANIIPRVASRQVAGVIPGILVALGILGTFLGLVRGLPALGSSVEIADLSQLIRQITNSLSLAFYTSIFGISFSVLFLFVDRMLIQRIESEVRGLSDVVAAAFRTLPTEEMGRLQFNLVKNAVDTLRHLGTDLASNLANIISPAFGEAVKTELAPMMQDVSSSLEKLADLMGETQIESLRAVVEGAVGSMNSAIGTQLDKLTGTIETTVAIQQELNGALSTFQKQLADSAQGHLNLIERTSQVASVLASSLDRLEKIASLLGAAGEGITAAARSVETSAIAAMKSLESAVDAQKELRTAVENQMLSLKTAREDLVAAWDATVQQARAAIFQIQEATRELGEGIGESLVKTLETFDGAAARIVSHFSGTLSQLDASIGELPPLVDALREAGQQLLSSSNAHTSELNRLEAVISGPLATATHEALEASGRAASAIESIQRLVAGAGKVSDELAASAQILAGVARSFEEVQAQTGQLVTAIEQINAHMPGVAQRLATLTASLDGPLTFHLNSIAETWNRMEPSFRELSALPQRIDSIRESLEAMQSGVTRELSVLSHHMENIPGRLDKISAGVGQPLKTGILGGLFRR